MKAPMQAGRYVTVLADPPWNEAGGGKKQRGANAHYPLMKTEEICALPVKEWTRDDAHLYLWVTNSFLPDGFKVMRAWGFEYKTCITWMKDGIGIGQYFRGKTEHCLFGVKGRVPYKMSKHGHARLQGVTGFCASKGKHSEKPNELRTMLMKVSPGPYLEMFARVKFPGWDVWGNEIQGRLVKKRMAQALASPRKCGGI